MLLLLKMLITMYDEGELIIYNDNQQYQQQHLREQRPKIITTTMEEISIIRIVDITTTKCHHCDIKTTKCHHCESTTIKRKPNISNATTTTQTQEEHLIAVCLFLFASAFRSKLLSIREAVSRRSRKRLLGGGETSRNSPRGVFPSRFLAPGPREPGFAQVRGHRVQPWTFEGVLFRVWRRLHAMVKTSLLCGSLW